MSGPKFTLSFSKKIEKKNLQPSAIRNDVPAEEKEIKESLESIEENVLKTDGKAEQEELVIPLVPADRFSILRRIAEKRLLEIDGNSPEQSRTSTSQVEESEDISKEPKVLTLDEQAEAAILEETKKRLEDWSDRDVVDNLTISQAGPEDVDDTKVTVGKESSLNDYDQVDVAVFGAALLRGMGWDKTEGIGRVTKQVVEVIDPTAKTFGLSNTEGDARKKNAENPSANQEELTLAKGSFVFIHSGRHRGTYGTVESLDDDHLLVKSAVGQDIIREVELNIRVVSQKEYKDSSRVINKDMYDKFKEEEAKKKEKNKPSRDTKEDDYERKSVKKERDTTQDKQGKQRKNLSMQNEVDYPDRELKNDRDRQNVKEHGDNHSRRDISERSHDFEKERPESIREKDLKITSDYKDSDRYKSERRKLEEKYDRTGDKYKAYDSSKEKYKTSQEDKYSSRPKSYSDRKPESQNSHSSERYSDKYNKSDGKVQKRRDPDGYEQEYKKSKKLQECMPAIPWVRENLRVRLINKSYKGGRYHKEKVIVKCVETAESCECISEEGKVLREVHPAWLETVIPKTQPQNILVVKGNHKGQRGQILQLHKDQEKASIQLLEDRTVILKLHYDDICEYVSRY